MMFFINMNTLNWLEKAFNLKINIFLKLFCPVGAATLWKKLVLCFIFFFHRTKFQTLFNNPWQKKILACLNYHIYLIFLNILAWTGVIIKVQKYPWNSRNTNWNRRSKKMFLSWLFASFLKHWRVLF